MKKKILALAPILCSALAFAQNVTANNVPAQTTWFSPYYPLINSPYVAGAIVLVRDVTIIIVLWMFFFKYFGEKDKK